MVNRKLTITVADDQLKEIRALVKAGNAASVPAFVSHAVKIALSDTAEWREVLKERLDRAGGPLTRKERAWADSVISAPHRKSRARS